MEKIPVKVNQKIIDDNGKMFIVKEVKRKSELNTGSDYMENNDWNITSILITINDNDNNIFTLDSKDFFKNYTLLYNKTCKHNNPISLDGPFAILTE